MAPLSALVCPLHLHLPAACLALAESSPLHTPLDPHLQLPPRPGRHPQYLRRPCPRLQPGHMHSQLPHLCLLLSQRLPRPVVPHPPLVQARQPSQVLKPPAAQQHKQPQAPASQAWCMQAHQHRHLVQVQLGHLSAS